MKAFALPVLAVFFCAAASAQNIGVGTSNPSAWLHVYNYSGNNIPALSVEKYALYMSSEPLVRFRRINTNVLSIDADNAGNMLMGGNAAPVMNTQGGATMNSFIGLESGLINSIGAYNTGVGAHTLRNTATAQFNTAVGYAAGSIFVNGYNNVFVGSNIEAGGNNYYNTIAVGQGTRVYGNSTARFGNSASVSYGGYAGWTNVSDGRFKTDVQENVPGLSFIRQLRPVTYRLAATQLDDFLHRDIKLNLTPEAAAVHQKALVEKEAILYSGFIAQEVEAAAISLGFDFSGIDKPASAKDNYGLRYAEFVVPLVKGMQEQQQMIEALQKQVAELKAMVEGRK